MNQPNIRTQRLTLRAFTLDDAPRVQQLAGRKEIADVTGNIPHPYPDGLAEQWIAQQPEAFTSAKRVAFAITLRDSDELMGCVSMMKLDTDKPEVGYWVGLDYWGNGYCTEACLAMMEFCRQAFQINKIYGRHLSRNPASGRVLEKCGLTFIKKDVGQGPFMTQEEEFKVYCTAG